MEPQDDIIPDFDDADQMIDINELLAPSPDLDGMIDE